MTDTQNVSAPETVATLAQQIEAVLVGFKNFRQHNCSMRLSYEEWDIVVAALHRLPTQYPLSQGGEAAFEEAREFVRNLWRNNALRGREHYDLIVLIDKAEKVGKPSPGAEAVANVLDTVSVVLLHAADILDDHGNVYADTVRSVQQQVLAALRSPAILTTEAEAVAKIIDRVDQESPNGQPIIRAAEWQAIKAALRSPAIPAPAQGVTVTTKMVERLAMFYERKRTHPPPRSIFDVPINTRQRIMDDARAALQAALHPTPTPAQGVTDEAVNRAMLAVQKGCDITPREMRRAIQAAFHPAEKE